MDHAADDILALWERVTNRLVFLEKRYVFRHGALRLHPSELHVLLAIRREPQANATLLAKRLGITKGAVSQVMNRLVTKRVITKHADSGRKNEVTAEFTKLGDKAITAFLDERAGMSARWQAHLASLSDHEKKTLTRFLELMGESLPDSR